MQRPESSRTSYCAPRGTAAYHSGSVTRRKRILTKLQPNSPPRWELARDAHSLRGWCPLRLVENHKRNRQVEDPQKRRRGHERASNTCDVLHSPWQATSESSSDERFLYAPCSVGVLQASSVERRSPMGFRRDPCGARTHEGLVVSGGPLHRLPPEPLCFSFCPRRGKMVNLPLCVSSWGSLTEITPLSPHRGDSLPLLHIHDRLSLAARAAHAYVAPRQNNLCQGEVSLVHAVTSVPMQVRVSAEYGGWKATAIFHTLGSNGQQRGEHPFDV